MSASRWSATGRRSVAPRAPIVKYIPQTGSGTAASSRRSCSTATAIDANCDASHQSISLQEHDARGVTAVSKPNAIYAFDWARWNAQCKGVEADLRNGATLGQAERQ